MVKRATKTPQMIVNEISDALIDGHHSPSDDQLAYSAASLGHVTPEIMKDRFYARYRGRIGQTDDPFSLPQPLLA